MDYLKTTPVVSTILKVSNPVYIRHFHRGIEELPDKEVTRRKSEQKDLVVAAIAADYGSSLLVFPEGGLTNGLAGLLRYEQFTFSMLGESVGDSTVDARVLPLAIRRTSFLPINVDTATTTFAWNLFFMFFQPYTRYSILVLPVMERAQGESPSDFAKSVQQITADALGVVATDHAKKAKILYVNELMAKEGGQEEE